MAKSLVSCFFDSRCSCVEIRTGWKPIVSISTITKKCNLLKHGALESQCSRVENVNAFNSIDNQATNTQRRHEPEIGGRIVSPHIGPHRMTDNDVISFRIHASCFSPPSCG